MTDQFGRPYDLDQSGRGFHKARSYLGPSLGWVETQILPERKINAAGEYEVNPGDSVILIEAGLPSTIILPDVREWVRQNATQPATGFTRGIWIKDYGGNSLTQHVTIIPFDQQTIDGLNQSFILAQNFGIIVVFPLVDGTGWWLAPMTYDTGTGGTTAINPTAPIAGNVVGNVMNVAMLFDPDAFRVNAGNQLTFEVCDPGFVLGNPTVGTDTPVYTSLSSMLDRAIGSTQGQIMIRNNVGWTFLNPGTVNQVLNSGGPGSNPFWGLPLQGSFLPITGGTLTGNLAISKSSPAMLFDFEPDTAAVFASRAKPSLNFRWQFIIADGSPEVGGNIGSNFRIDRYADDGSFLGTPISISRHDGQVIVRNGVFIGTPSITLQFDPGTPSVIASQTTGGLPRWLLALGDGTAETGGNVGSNFGFNRYDDGGNFLGSVMTAIRATGEVFIPGLQNYQPRDADLTALSGLTGTNTIYYRSGVDTWSPVVIGANLAFTGGVLSAASGGGGSLVVGASTVSNGVTTRILFNNGGILGEYDAANATGFLNTFTASLKGLVPLSGGGTVNYLRADGTWSPPPATGGIVEPVGDGFWGRNMLSGLGTWEQAVKKAGDEMTGNLTIAPASGVTGIFLDKSASGTSSQINGQLAGVNRWALQLGDATAEAGGNVGSDFRLLRFSDAGANLGAPIIISRLTGLATVGGNPTDPLGIATKQYVDTKGNVSNVGTPTNGQWVRWTSATTIEGVNASATDFVRKTGDVMTGNLTLTLASPTMQLNSTAAAPTNLIQASKSGTQRWQMYLGDGSAETGLNSGANFRLVRCTDGGVANGETLTILRDSGNVLLGSGNDAGATAAKLQISAREAISVFNWSTTTQPPVISFHHSKSNTVGTVAPVADGDSLGLIAFLGAGTTGFGLAAQIQCLVMGAPSGNVIPGGYGFDTRPPGGSLGRKMTITSGGSVVVGPMPFALAGGIFEVNNESAQSLGGAFWNKWSNDNIGSVINLRKSRGLTSNIFAALQAFDVIGAIEFYGSYSAGWAGFGPSIRAICSAVPVANGTPGYLSFSATDPVGNPITVANFASSGCSIMGTVTNDNATAGFVGEYKENTWSSVGISPNTASTLAQVNLGAGDWDVWVNGYVIGGAAATTVSIGLNTVAVTLPGGAGNVASQTAFAGFINTITVQSRFSLAAAGNVYLNVLTGTESGATFTGRMCARRRR